MKILESTRVPDKKIISKQILLCAGILVLGVILGVFQKYLDISQAELPSILMKIDELLDLHNFFGGFSFWIVIAVCIAVYSCSPLWAGVKVFSFFVGMITSYYLYSYYVGGFFPKSYAMIWITLTIASPFLAYLCWYSKGKGWVAILLSAGVLGFLINTTFAYGMWYIDVRSLLEVLMFLLGIFILRKGQKEMFLEIVLSIPFAIFMKVLIPFAIWA